MDHLDWTSAVAAVGGAIAALFAALAAHRSARTANAMLSHEAAVEHRELRQRVLETAQRVVTERARAGEFLEKLRLEMGNMKSRSYGTEVRALAEAEEKLDPLSERAGHALRDEAALRDRSQEELLSLSASLFSDLTELRVIKEKHRDDLATLRARSQSFRSKGNR